GFRNCDNSSFASAGLALVPLCKILFRGRSVQTFRDPGFLGIVSPDNDAVYLPLKKGSNDLTLAVSELGGWMGLHLPLGGLEKLALGAGNCDVSDYPARLGAARSPTPAPHSQ